MNPSSIHQRVPFQTWSPGVFIPQGSEGVTKFQFARPPPLVRKKDNLTIPSDPTNKWSCTETLNFPTYWYISNYLVTFKSSINVVFPCLGPTPDSRCSWMLRVACHTWWMLLPRPGWVGVSDWLLPSDKAWQLRKGKKTGRHVLDVPMIARFYILNCKGMCFEGLGILFFFQRTAPWAIPPTNQKLKQHIGKHLWSRQNPGTLLKINMCPENPRLITVGRCIPHWNSPFLGDMLVFRGVYPGPAH